MMPEALSHQDKLQLLKLAREALEQSVCGEALCPLDLSCQPPCLQAPGATFVTLMCRGELRGCIGTIEAHQPLAEDVREHAMAAALHDFRFPPVCKEELPEITIELSWLTPLKPLAYSGPDDLLCKLRPGIDGVVIRDGSRRATFLPQVWEKLPRVDKFLDHLCLKMGSLPQQWRCQKLEVFTYQVEKICEAQPGG